MSFKRRILIVGGAGFIGLHLVRALLESGRDIRVISRGEQKLLHLPGKVEYFQGDFRNRDFLRDALDRVDEVIDLAYSTVPKTSYENPLLDITENLPGSVGLFEMASELPIKKLIFVSSGGTVYGEPEVTPIQETHATNPISPYGITKLALEKYAQFYHKLKGLPVVCVRPSNPYGIGQKAFVGQGFVSTAVASLLTKKEIVIFGEKGTVRDYIYVADLVEGIVAALEAGVPGECYNIGSGIGRSNLDIIQALIQLAQESGIKPVIRHDPPRSFDVTANILDCSKLYQATGWKPKTSLNEGLQLTWDWLATQYH